MSEKSCAFITSDTSIKVFGCDGIEKYSLTETVLKLKELVLTVKGEGLTLSAFGGGEVGLCGRINGIEICRTEGGKC